MRLRLPFTREQKQHPAGAAFMEVWGGGWVRPKDPQRHYLLEGYQGNVVVYAAVQEIATAAASLVVEVHGPDGQPIEEHPALALLERPNVNQGWDAFCKELFIAFGIYGEMALAAYPPTGRGIPQELWPLSPADIEIKPGPRGVPLSYMHKRNSHETMFPVDQINGRGRLFFHKRHNPDDYWRGQSPLMAAALAGDLHNVGLNWNYRMLRNNARPPGIIKMLAGVSQESIARAREYFKKAIQGSDNAGEIPMLPDGMEWVPVGQSPADMDYQGSLTKAEKLIARAYGVPLPLIDNDAATFNNVREAKLRFYTDTVLPLFNEFLGQFGNWLLPAYGEGLKFGVDMDAIPALEPLRDAAFNRMIKAAGNKAILTPDEARVALGWEELGGAATMLDPVGNVTAGAADIMRDRETEADEESQTDDAVKAMTRMAYGQTA